MQELLTCGSLVIADAAMKCRSVLETHRHALVSISGGADSDVMMDLVERCRPGSGCKVTYVWFDTGIEYRATKMQISYLEGRYGRRILRLRPEKTIPMCVKEFGQPFMSKYVSTAVARLQSVGFKWENLPYAELVGTYGKQSSSLKWWTDSVTKDRSKPTRYDIGFKKHLKEFMVENPPWFRISSKCCKHTKKDVAETASRELEADVQIVGVRRSEGGTRWDIGTCFTAREGGVDTYRPLFWFKYPDRDLYTSLFGIQNSLCYGLWGFRRTGCAGCPFNRHLFDDLQTVDMYEPNIAKAARRIFADSYEYTRMFNEYKRRAKGLYEPVATKDDGRS